MLIKTRVLEGIRAGEISLVFRRWRRARVRAGSRIRTAIGELEIDSVERVAMGELTVADARAAGYASRAELLRELGSHTGTTWRIAVRYAGPDRRQALRSRARMTRAELAELEARLARMDGRSQDGPWTRAALEIIARHPGVRAGDLADRLGQERLYFKRRVRRLKELGLTISLKVGYELSPRGRAFLKSAG